MGHNDIQKNSAARSLKDVYPAVLKLEQANLSRTRYLLQNYSKYRALCPTGLDIHVSRAVLDILSFNLSDRERFTQEDCDLADRCGLLLAPAILEAAEEIKSFPIEVASKVYPVLYHQYFSLEGAAIDFEQLEQRLEPEDINASAREIRGFLSDGERMMATMLFRSKFAAAMRACS